MKARSRITLVFPDSSGTVLDWDRPERDHSVITVSNFNLLHAALQAGVEEFGRDIERVIFDRSVDADDFLSFLCSLPAEFRGDVLRIRPDGSGTISASSPRGDGRFLYSLSVEDVGFYLRTVTNVGFFRMDATADGFSVSLLEDLVTLESRASVEA